MTNYEYFLSNCGILPEDLFNDVVNSLPECNIQDIDFDVFNADSQDEIATFIIDHILGDWNYVYSSEVNFEDKTFYLEDCEFLEDLEEITERFDNTNWHIINYEDIKEEIQESNKKEDEEIKKHFLFNSIINNISLKDLEEFANAHKK